MQRSPPRTAAQPAVREMCVLGRTGLIASDPFDRREKSNPVRGLPGQGFTDAHQFAV